MTREEKNQFIDNLSGRLNEANVFYLADIARDYVNNNPDYKLYSFEDSIAVCFNYKDYDTKDLCTQLYRQGELMVGYGKFKEDEFIRLVMVNGGNSKEDILNFFKKLEEFANTKYKATEIVNSTHI